LKLIGIIAVILCGGLLIYGTADFPACGDPESPASYNVSAYYIEKAMEETSVPNIVTAVLADYRGFDTMFETAVIFSAAIACFFLLRRTRQEKHEVRFYRHLDTGITLRISHGGTLPESSKAFEEIDGQWVPYDFIIKTTSRLLIPFIQLFALYVIAHGHHSPGGGFQGGVILGASLILFAISYDLRTALRRMSEKAGSLLFTAGVAIFAGTGTLCILLGGNFLDYAALSNLLGTDVITARSHGILIVEIGVGMAVMAVMVFLYCNLSSAGTHDEGL
jgi:multicomponent Na+:H+ antiporter subunit B